MASISLTFIGFCCKSIVGLRGDAPKIVLFQISYECTVHHIGHKISSQAVFMVELFLIAENTSFIRSFCRPSMTWSNFLINYPTPFSTSCCDLCYDQKMQSLQRALPPISECTWDVSFPFILFDILGNLNCRRTARTKQASAWIQSKFVMLQPLIILSTRRLLFKSWLSSLTFPCPSTLVF